MKKLKDR